MRTRTTVAGTLAAGLLLVACGGAGDVAPAVEVDEPVDDGADADAAVAAGDDAVADEDLDAVADEDLDGGGDEDEAVSAPADDTPDSPMGEPDVGTLDDPCANHQGREADAFIDLVTPVDEQSVSGEVELVGCSNVYEATVAWTLLDGDGRSLDEGFTTAECGTGCVGEFRETVSLETAADEPVAYLQVFSPNASDEGPRQLQLTEVILVIG